MCMWYFLINKLFLDFDGIEIHTKLEVNRPESFMTGHEEADTELKGPTVSSVISDRQVWANSVDPDQIAPEAAL